MTDKNMFADKVLDWAKNQVQGSDVQKNALNSLLEKGLPGPKNEEYKYFPISRKLEKAFPEFEFKLTDETDKTPSLPFEFEADQLIRFHNGKRVEAEDSDKFKLTKLESGNQSNDPFDLLNLAAFDQGLDVTPVENSLSLVIFHTYDGSSPVIAQPRVKVQVPQRKELTVIEVYYSTVSEPVFVNTAIEIDVEADSHLKYYKLGLDNEQVIHVGNSRISQKKNSVATCYTFTFGGDMVRNNLHISLDDEHVESNMYGLSLIGDSSEVDNHTEVDHRFANCFSNELYKGIYKDRSTGVFNGKIFVRQDAQKTNAFQSNKNILLSDNASVNTKPQLEIWADDVKCSHGATTGQLDKDQLFYLRARGIKESKAKAMLVKAFAQDILDRVPEGKIKDILEKYIEEGLNEK